MSEAEINDIPVSEESIDTGAVMDSVTEPTPVRQVPLKALENERHKRQQLEERNRLLEEALMRQHQAETTKHNEEEDNELVNRRELRQFQERMSKEELVAMKREIAEDTYKEVNPEAIKQINLHLKEILERKPWLAGSIQEAPNRYARAYEIVQDYAPVVQAKRQSAVEAQKIVENSKKPGSPVSVAKASGGSQTEYLKSIAGTPEFSKYRKQLLGR